MVQHIKREHPGLDVICGNVVTSWQVGGRQTAAEGGGAGRLSLPAPAAAAARAAVHALLLRKHGCGP